MPRDQRAGLAENNPAPSRVIPWGWFLGMRQEVRCNCNRRRRVDQGKLRW
jgi:hypothetical protein